jgi:ankyrin repeat protein
VDVNCKDKYGETPLSMAIGSCFLGVVNAILSNPKIDFEIPNAAGKFPSEIAAETGDPAIIAAIDNHLN